MIQTFDYTVQCLRDSRIRKMQARYSDYLSVPVYRPCNGCEFMDGSQICADCLGRITRYLQTSPDPAELHARCPLGEELP